MPARPSPSIARQAKTRTSPGVVAAPARPAPNVRAFPSKRPAPPARRAPADDDAALIADIRFLGRILGDVIREQEGREAFELIERVRRLSVAYRRESDADAGRTLDRLLKNLSIDQTVSVIRAFTYFSHLANIAEDHQQVRRIARPAPDRKSTRLNSSHRL